MHKTSGYHDCLAGDCDAVHHIGANAAIYKFTFESTDAELTATGEIHGRRRGQVTAMSRRHFRPDQSDHQRGDRQSELPEPVLQPRRFFHL